MVQSVVHFQVYSVYDSITVMNSWLNKAGNTQGVSLKYNHILKLRGIPKYADYMYFLQNTFVLTDIASYTHSLFYCSKTDF